MTEAPMEHDQTWIQLGLPGQSTSIAPSTFHGVIGETCDIEVGIKNLRARGIEAGKIDETPWGKFCWLKDPDGNGKLAFEMNYFSTISNQRTNLHFMKPVNKTQITIETTINAPVDKVWQLWTGPEHIKKWNNASPDWHTPRAENDLRVGGKFLSRMEAKDESFGFDFFGFYDEVIEHQVVAYTLGDGRKVKIIFSVQGKMTKVTETFEAENENPIDMQKGGWQAILDNFKRYAEGN